MLPVNRAPEVSLSHWPMFPRPIKPSARANRKSLKPGCAGPHPQVQPLPLLALGSQAPMTSSPQNERCDPTEGAASPQRPGNMPGDQTGHLHLAQTSTQFEAPRRQAATRGPCKPPGGFEGLSKYRVVGQYALKLNKQSESCTGMVAWSSSAVIASSPGCLCLRMTQELH